MAPRMLIYPQYVLESGYRRVVFGQNPGRIVARLVAARGAPVTLSELIEVICFDRDDGGPDWVESTVLTAIHNVRRRIVGMPFQIVNEYRTGYRFVPSEYVAPMFQSDEPYPDDERYCGPYKYVARHLPHLAIPFVRSSEKPGAVIP